MKNCCKYDRVELSLWKLDTKKNWPTDYTIRDEGIYSNYTLLNLDLYIVIFNDTCLFYKYEYLFGSYFENIQWDFSN